MPTAYGYARVSTLRQANDGDSLDMQRRQIEQVAAIQGATSLVLAVDEGVSGGVPLADRPQGKMLLNSVQPGDTVYVSKLDRMFRSALDALQMSDLLAQRGVGLYLIDLGGDVTRSAFSKFFLTVVAAFAEMEKARIRERTQMAKQYAKSIGKFSGGNTPFGFQNDDGKLVPDLVEQEMIEEILALRSIMLTPSKHKYSMRQAADEVNSRHPGHYRHVSHMTVKRAEMIAFERAGKAAESDDPVEEDEE